MWTEHKLFIGMLPKGASKADVMAVFSPYGTVKELSVIKGSQPTSKGDIYFHTLFAQL
jgi:CUG-BP- and ETR3-like factor